MRKWHHYHLEAKLGSGATSDVYRARHEDSEERFALKIFWRAADRDEPARPDLESALDKELSLQSRLSHPNIVKCFEKIRWRSEVALRLEWVEGENLRDFQNLFRIPLLEPKYWILAQIARGLGAAHEQGILHRDLKPENVLVSRVGEVKLTDFGLARFEDQRTSNSTQAGAIMGSIPYMAPELLAGGRAQVASDLFSFGALAYEFLAGTHPFRADTPEQTLRLLTEGKFVPLRQINPRVPEKLGLLIDSCLAKKPESRPVSVWAVESELLTFLQASGLLADCRRLVAADERESALPTALEKKHRALKNELDRRFSGSAPPLWLINELASLFPNDPLVPDFLSRIAHADRAGRRHMRIAVISALATALASLLLFIYIRGAPGPAAETAVSQPAIRPLAVAPKPPLPKPATQIPNKPLFGHLRLSAANDVRITVDGREIPSHRWRDIALKSGSHRIVMSKDGYRPIAKEITVHAGRWLNVNAVADAGAEDATR